MTEFHHLSPSTDEAYIQQIMDSIGVPDHLRDFSQSSIELLQKHLDLVTRSESAYMLRLEKQYNRWDYNRFAIVLGHSALSVTSEYRQTIPPTDPDGHDPSTTQQLRATVVIDRGKVGMYRAVSGRDITIYRPLRDEHGNIRQNIHGFNMVESAEDFVALPINEDAIQLFERTRATFGTGVSLPKKEERTA